MWVKGTKKYIGGALHWKDEKGREYVTYNPTPEFLKEQGWVEEVVEQNPETVRKKSLREEKEEVIRECNAFYNSIILKIPFNGDLIWVPLVERQAYTSFLKNLQEAGKEKITYRDVTLPISEALDFLRKVDLYEYECREVHIQHLRAITKAETSQELKKIDFTLQYPSPEKNGFSWELQGFFISSIS